MLPFRNKVREVRRVMNHFANYKFKLVHEKHPVRGDYGKWDYEELIKYLVREFGLTEMPSPEMGLKYAATDRLARRQLASR